MCQQEKGGHLEQRESGPSRDIDECAILGGSYGAGSGHGSLQLLLLLHL